MKLWKVILIAAFACWVGIFVIAVVDPKNVALAVFFLVAFFPLMIASICVRSAGEEQKARRHAKKTKRILDNTPVAAELVAIQEKMRGSVVVGGLTGGPIGAALGAYIGKERATFAVRYASGRTSVETVVVNSQRFKTLSAFLKK